MDNNNQLDTGLEAGAERNPELYLTDEEMDAAENRVRERVKVKIKNAVKRQKQGQRKPKKSGRKAKARSPKRKLEARKCARKSCGKRFKPRDPRQKWCSFYCGNKVRTGKWWAKAGQAMRLYRQMKAQGKAHEIKLDHSKTGRPKKNANTGKKRNRKVGRTGARRKASQGSKRHAGAAQEQS